METRIIEINVFGQLKDHFPTQFPMEVGSELTVQGILRQLTDQTPRAGKVLAMSRVAVSTHILKPDASVDDYVALFIIPPSSGG